MSSSSSTSANNNNNNNENNASNSTTPGVGWSNGDIHPQMFASSRNGKLQLYSSQRRFLHLAHGWSRVGGGSGGNSGDGEEGQESTTDEFSHRTSVSNTGSKIQHNLEEEAITVRSLIAQLCETFYKFGWATGTGGGVSIRVGGPSENRPWRVFVAPSGIQKEDMIGDDIFELDMDRNIVVAPKTPNLRQSACTPLWYVVYKNRPTAKSVIHTHSQHAVLATLLDPTESSKTLRITHLEMLKGVGHHAYDDMLEIPIIDNRPSEDLLAEQLEQAINEYPSCNCVLVRRHGLYVWGDSWEQAKTQCESFDYLFETVVNMKKMGLDPAYVPLHGTYRVEETRPAEETTATAAATAAATTSTTVKKRKATHPPSTSASTATATDGWNGISDVDNVEDLKSNTLPILPRDAKYLLLDIEGCTTSISFVHDTLFPYVLEHIDEYLKTLEREDYLELADSLTNDCYDLNITEGVIDPGNIPNMVQYLVKNDVKVPSLKTMQGKMWKVGYEKGDLHGHVYADVVPMLQWMQTHGVRVYIYSSGSVQAQKLLFGHSNHGDLLEFIDGHFDITTSGNKKHPSSYMNIAQSLGISPGQLVFCSDSEAELQAAKEAYVSVVMTIRPGNAPLSSSDATLAYPKAFSLLQLCGN